MNPATLLALIAELYENLSSAKAQIEQLTEQLEGMRSQDVQKTP